MNDTIKSIATLLKDLDGILIFPHVNMDGDALGSATALCLALRQLGKKTHIMINEPIPKNLDEKKRLIQNLRGYLEQGGFIFAEALDGDVSFEEGFRELMRETLSDDGGELALLDPTHPIWSAEKPVPAEYARPVYGIDFGCRTSVVFVPAYKPRRGDDGSAPSVFGDRPSLSCLWEAATKRPRGASATNPPTAKALEEQEAAFILGVNICAYATNRQMKFKDEIAADVAEELEKNRDAHNSLFAGILDCGAGSTCAPRAIPNLMKTIRSRLGVPVQLYTPHTSLRDDDVFDYPTLFMHGRNAFSLNEEERERLRRYFERGGFIFANAVCASPAFSKSIEAELAEVLPGEELVDVPADDALFTGKYGGFKIEKLQYRLQTTDREGKTAAKTVESAPKLKGIARDGRWIFLFSPYDVSCALENKVATNCEGLTQKSAFYLATNVLFYAAESF